MKTIFNFKTAILFSLLLGTIDVKSQCPIAATVTNNCIWGDIIEAYILNGIATGGVPTFGGHRS